MSGSRTGTAAPAPGRATVDPAAALLRGGLLPASGAGAVVVVAGVPAGAGGVAGAVLGAVLAAAALAVGPLIMRPSRRWSPPAVMAVALLSFAVTVVVLGVAGWWLAQIEWLSRGHVAAALIACCLAWIGGELRAAGRLRVLAFGSPVPAPSGTSPQHADGAGQSGSGGPGTPWPH